MMRRVGESGERTGRRTGTPRPPAPGAASSDAAASAAPALAAAAADAAPRGYAKGRTTRRHVVAAATGLFAEVGYRAASLREVAARSGLTHPGLLHHFPTKAALLAAVLEQRDEADAARYLPGTGDALEQLRDLVRLVEHNSEVPALVELHATLSAEAVDPAHPAHAWCVARYEATRRQFTGVMERAAAEGVLAPGVEPRTAAVALAALMDGLQVQWLLDRGAVDMPAVVRDHVQRLVTVPLNG